MARAVVIGGGISGLAVAAELQGTPGLELEVLEASPFLGGNIQTERVDGWVLEAGPNAFLNRHPSTLRLAMRLGLEDELVSANEAARRRFILVDGRLRRFPDSLASFLSSDLLSLKGRARVLAEPMVPARSKGREESVADFASRRLGREGMLRLLDPVVAGIYAGDPRRLSAEAALPQLTRLEEQGMSLLETLVRSREKKAAPSGVSPTGVGMHRMVTFRGGMGRLVEALAGAVGGSVSRESPVEKLSREGNRWRIEIGGPRPRVTTADVVISTTPVQSARRFLGGLHPDLDRACVGVPTAPVAVVTLGFRELEMPHPLHGFGYLVPSTEREKVLGVMWSSSMFPGLRSPRGHVLLRVFLGGVRDPAICSEDDQDLVLASRAHLSRSLGLTADPVLARCFRHRVGIPQYELGHRRRIQVAERALLNLPGLVLAGNSLRGVGVNHCTAVAETAAENALSYLEALRPAAPVSTGVAAPV